jgi:hypothetical protein
MAPLKDTIKPGQRCKLIKNLGDAHPMPIGTICGIRSVFQTQIKLSIAYTTESGIDVKGNMDVPMEEFGEFFEMVTDRSDAEKVQIVRASEARKDYRPVEKAQDHYEKFKEQKGGSTPPPTSEVKVEEDPMIAKAMNLAIWFQVGSENLFWNLKDCWKHLDTDNAKRNILNNTHWRVAEDKKGGEFVVISIPPEDARWTRKSKGYKHVATCAFDATDSFLKFVKGGALHHTDKTWYTEHPATVSAGLPAHKTISMLNDLVEPWGYGVSEVYMRSGQNEWEEVPDWKLTLGCNPKGAVDLETTDEEFVKEFMSCLPEGFTDDERDEATEYARNQVKDVHFHYVRELPKKPLVIFEGGYATGYAEGGGHASFRAPRSGKSDRWFMALAYDRIENCTRYVDAPTLKAEEAQVPDDRELDLYECLTKNGQPIRSILYGGGKSWGGSPYQQQQQQGGGHGRGNDTTPMGFRQTGRNPSGVLGDRPPKLSRRERRQAKQAERNGGQQQSQGGGSLGSGNPASLQYFNEWCTKVVQTPLYELNDGEMDVDEERTAEVLGVIDQVCSDDEGGLALLYELTQGMKNWKKKKVTWRDVDDIPGLEEFVQVFYRRLDDAIEVFDGLLTVAEMFIIHLALERKWDREFAYCVSHMMATIA